MSFSFQRFMHHSCLGMLFLLCSYQSKAINFIVSNTSGDNIPGSFARAIQDANLNIGIDSILFNIDAGPANQIQVIAPNAVLPTITDPVVIDGESQNRHRSVHDSLYLIAVDGSNIGGTIGLNFQSGSGSSTLLQMRLFDGFDDIIRIEDAPSITVRNCLLGTDATGNTAVGAQSVTGIFISNSTATRVMECIIGNTSSIGVNIESSSDNTTLRSNLIGISKDGTSALDTDGDGVYIGLNTNVEIGGPNVNDGNVIGSVTSNAIEVLIESDLTIRHNIIGVDASLTVDHAVSGEGILMNTCSNCLIEDNIITNTSLGINLADDDCDDVSIQRNSIFNNINEAIEFQTIDVNYGFKPPVIAGIYTAGSDTVAVGKGSPNNSLQLYGTFDDEADKYFDTVHIDSEGDWVKTINGIGGININNITALQDSLSNSSELSAPMSITAPLCDALYVTTDSDDGTCGTLRFAIAFANLNPGPDTIEFDSDYEIYIAMPLDTIFDDSTVIIGDIDGDSIADVAIDGSAMGGGNLLTIMASYTHIDGLMLVNSPSNGIRIEGNANTDNIVTNCMIGVDDGGAAGNGDVGIYIQNSSNNIIGDTAGNGNFIGDNSIGIYVENSFNNYIVGNSIGLDIAGDPYGNSAEGLLLNSSDDNFIGTSNIDGGNIIVANGNGISLTNNSSGNHFFRNNIGVLDDDLTAEPNSGEGLIIDGGSDNVIGDTLDGYGNLIGANGANGIFIRGATATNNIIEGNLIGVAGDDITPLGNTFSGVRIDNGASGTYIEYNRIANNGQSGIAFDMGAAGNEVYESLIYDNTNGAITIVGAGTQNNIGAPVVDSFYVHGADTLISGTADPGAWVQVFTDDAGQGEEYIEGISADAAGDWEINVSGYGLSYLTNLTAMQVESNHASEFSAPLPASIMTVIAVCDTFTVNDTLDVNTCGTLRFAIDQANSLPGPDTIEFNIPYGPTNKVQRITLGSELPLITDTLFIDGVSQNANRGAGLSERLIEIFGDNSVDRAFNFSTGSDESHLTQLVINNFTNEEVLINGADFVIVDSCYIGIDSTGLVDQGIGTYGFRIVNALETIIEGNVIGGNNAGLFVGLNSDSTIIRGNYIGLGVDGNTNLGHNNIGILVNNSDHVMIGGPLFGDENIIANSGGNGIELTNGADSIILLRNVVGLNSTASTAQPNGANGIHIDGSIGTQIGNGVYAARNIISRNASNGISIVNGSHNTSISGNMIGTSSTGLVGRGNNQAGIHVENSLDTEIGTIDINIIADNGVGIELDAGANNAYIYGNNIGLGGDSSTALGNGQGIIITGGSAALIEENNIAFNTVSGIEVGVAASIDNEFHRNSIFDNGGQGITIAAGNENIAPPSISEVIVVGVDTVVYGTSEPNALVQLFADAADEGEFYIDEVKADGAGEWSLKVVGLDAYTAMSIDSLTATQDSSNNTSEFSAPVFATPSTCNPFAVTSTSDANTCGTLRFAIAMGNSNPGIDTIFFAINGGTDSTVQRFLPASPYDTITEGLVFAGQSQNIYRGADSALHLIEISGVLTPGIGLNFAPGADSSHVHQLIVNNWSVIDINLNGVSHSLITNNYLGLDSTGLVDQCTANTSLMLNNAEKNQVIGNLIGGASIDGISLFSADSNAFKGNVIGIGSDLTSAIPNTSRGMLLDNSQGNVIGGDSTEGNLIGHNGLLGIELQNGSVGNSITHNVLGTDTSLALNLANGNVGIYINSGSSENFIAQNIITNHTSNGIEVDGAASIRNKFHNNSIYNNANDGINISNGAQEGITFPIVTDMLVYQNDTIAFGFAYPGDIVQVFADTDDEGEVLIDTVTAGADSSWAMVVTGVAAYGFTNITALKDSAGNTSRFSNSLPIASACNPLIVTDPGNNNTCSTLRFAINFSNSIVGPDTIRFNMVAMGTNIINVPDSLPAITDHGTYIDGDANMDGTADIELNGGSAPIGTNGLLIKASYTTIDHMFIAGFPGDGIRMVGMDSNNVVIGSLIGQNSANNIDGNGRAGIYIENAIKNYIGDTIPGNGNAIVNNLDGVRINNADENRILNNTIGLNFGGASRGNTQHGIFIDGTSNGNHVGGSAPNARNVISSNGNNGIYLSGGNSTLIHNNYIGTNLAGLGARGNGSSGILIDNSPNNQIGSLIPGEGNVITSNSFSGVTISGIGSTDNDVRGNNIGLAMDSVGALSNTLDGIRIDAGVTGTIIDMNNIAFNGQIGVRYLNGSDQNRLFAGSIYANTNGGILRAAGTQNNINPPSLTEINIVGGDTVLIGTSLANATIQVYVDDFNQGAFYIANDVADGAGNWQVVINGYSGFGMDSITATQDDGTRTSAFAAPISTVFVPECNSFDLSLSASGPVVFCMGGQVDLQSNESGANEYLWNNGQSGQVTTITQSGFYWANLYGGGCHVKTDSIYVRVYPQKTNEITVTQLDKHGPGAPTSGSDQFGASIANIGDLDKDGVNDLLIGAPGDDAVGPSAGAAYIHLLMANGAVKQEYKLNSSVTNLGFPQAAGDSFGAGVTALGDFDKDGVLDIAVGVPNFDDGGASTNDFGAIILIAMNTDGTVKTHRVISQTDITNISVGDRFGSSITNIGDIDGDGVTDLAVGASFNDDGGANTGSVWILLMNDDATVKSNFEFENSHALLAGILAPNDRMGTSVSAVGDINKDGVMDIAIGVPGSDNVNSESGTVIIAHLTSSGGVGGVQAINNSSGGFNSELLAGDNFGTAVGPLGDINGNSVPDVIVGATGDDDGAANKGAFYLLSLRGNASVKGEFKVSDSTQNIATTLTNNGNFGSAVTGRFDLDEDGFPEFVVGAMNEGNGAYYILESGLNLVLDTDTAAAMCFSDSLLVNIPDVDSVLVEWFVNGGSQGTEALNDTLFVFYPTGAQIGTNVTINAQVRHAVGGCVVQTTESKVIFVNGEPDNSLIVSNDSICVGQDITTSIQSDAGIAYFLIDRSSGTTLDTIVGDGAQIDFIISGATQDTLFDVLAMDTTTGCSVMLLDSAEIFVTSPPAATFLLSDDEICTGDVANMNLNGTEAGLYYQLRQHSDSTAIDGPYLGTGGPLVFNDTPSDTTEYHVIAIDSAFGCVVEMTDRGIANVKEYADTTGLTPLLNAVVCAGDTLNVPLNATDAALSYNLRWGGDSTNIASLTTEPGNGGTVVLQTIPPADTNYYVHITSATVCEVFYTPKVQVTIAPPITNTISATDPTVCFGDSATITLGTSQSNHIYSLVYVSDTSTMVDGPFGGTDGTPLDFRVLSLTDTNYTVVIEDTINGCIDYNTDPAQLTLEAIPDTSMTLSDTTVCQGETVGLRLSMSYTNVAYDWYLEDSTFITNYSSGTGGVLTHNHLADTSVSYFVVATNNFGLNCNAVVGDSAIVAVNPNPVVAGMTVTGGDFCENDTAFVTISASSLTHHYQLRYLGDSSDISPLTFVQGNGGALSIGFVPSPGTTDVVVFAENNPGPACGVYMPDSARVRTINLPDNSMSLTDPAICSGDEAVITLANSFNDHTYTLVRQSDSSVVDGPFGGTNGSTIDFRETLTSDENYTVLIIDTLSTCRNYTLDGAFVTVDTLPLSPFTLNDVTICNTDDTIISLNGSVTGIDYILRLHADSSELDTLAGTGSALDFTVSPSVSTTYHILAQNPSGTMCAVQLAGTGTVTVNPLPDTTFTLSGPGMVCESDTAAVIINPSLTGLTYQLRAISDSSTVSTFVNGDGGPVSLEFVAASSASFVVYVRDLGTNCENYHSDSATLNMVNYPDTSLVITDPRVCESDSAYLTLPVSVAGFTYELQAADSSTIAIKVSTGAPMNYGIANAVDADYLLLITDPTSTCVVYNNDIGEVRVDTLPDHNFLLSDPTVCIGDSASLTINNSVVGISYLLQTHADSSSVLDTVAGTGGPIIFDSVFPPDTTMYHVISIDDATGCDVQLADLGTVNTLSNPDPDASSLSNSFACIGDSGVVTVSPTSDFYTYTLKRLSDDVLVGGPADGSTIGGDVTFNVGPTDTTEYYVTVTDTLAFCSNNLNDTATLAIINLPDANVDLSDPNTCENDSTDLVITTPATGYTYYLIRASDSLLVDSLSGANTVDSLRVFTTINDAYYLHIVDDVYSCINTSNDSGFVTIDTLPDHPFLLDDPQVCPDVQSYIELDNSVIGVSYALYNDANDTLVSGPLPGDGDSLTFNIGVSPLVPVNYYVIATNTATSCDVRLADMGMLSMAPLPDMTHDILGETVCSDEVGFVTLTTSDSGIFYQAYRIGDDTFLETPIQSLGDSMFFEIQPSPHFDYLIRATGTCSVFLEDTVQMQYLEPAHKGFFFSSNLVCEGDSATLSIPWTFNYMTYQVVDNADSSAVGPAKVGFGGPGLSFNVPAVMGREYQFYVINNNNNCQGYAGFIHTMVTDTIPVSSFTLSDPSICPNQDSSIILSGSVNGINYALVNAVEDTIQQFTGDGNPYTFTNITSDTSTIYLVRAYNPVTECSGEFADTSFLTVIPPPDPTHEIIGDSICDNAQATITLNTSDVGVVYELMFMDTTSVPIAPDTSVGGVLTFDFNPDSTGYFRVKATESCSSILDDTAFVYMDSPIDSTLSITDTRVCFDEVAFFELSGTMPGFNYQLRRASDHIPVDIPRRDDLATGSVTLQTIADSTRFLEVLITNDLLACTQINDSLAFMEVDTLPINDFDVQSITVCPNYDTSLAMSSSISGIKYVLQTHDDSVSVSDTLLGTGGPLLFEGVQTPVQRDYHVMAIDTVTGCSGQIDSVGRVFVRPLPDTVALVASSAVICFGESVNLTLGGTNGQNSYSMFDAQDTINPIYAGILGGGSLNFNVSPLDTTVYRYYVEDNITGCGLFTQAPKISRVNVIPAPDTTLSVIDDEICIGDTGSIQILNTDPGHTYSLRYMHDSSLVAFSGASATSTGGTLVLEDIPTMDSNYVVLITDANSCQYYNDSAASITVNELPVASGVLSDPVLCPEADTVITLSGTNIGFEYYLRDDVNDTIASDTVLGNNGIVDIPYTAPGISTNYYAIVRDPGTTCEAAVSGDLSIVTIQPLPSIAGLTAVSDDICHNDNAVIGIGTSINAYSYSLFEVQDSITPVAIDTGNGGLLNFTVSPFDTTDYIYYITDLGTTCGLFTNEISTVNVIPSPDTSYTLSDPSICDGGSAEIVLDTTYDSSIRYTLLFTSTMTSVGPGYIRTGINDSMTFSVSPVTTTSYSLLIEDLVTTCSAINPDTALVIVDTLPLSNFTIEDVDFCPGQDTVIALSNSVSGVGYVLQNAATDTSVTDTLMGNGLPLSFAIDPMITTNYHIVAIDTFSGCSVQFVDTAIATQQPLPDSTLSILGDTVCFGASASVSIPSSQALNYTLVRVFDNTVVDNQNSAGGPFNFTVNTDSLTTYRVEATLGICTVNMNDTAQVHVIPALDTNLPITDNEACFGDSTSITLSSIQAGMAYSLIRVSDNALMSGPHTGAIDSVNFEFEPVATDDYEVIITDTTIGCTDTNLNTSNVVVNPLPSDPFTLNDLLICPGQDTVITLNGSRDYVSYTLTDIVNGVVGSPVKGTNGAIDFPIAPFTYTQYTILAMDTTTGCDVLLADTGEVNMQSAPDVNFAVVDDTVCLGAVAQIILPTSEAGVQYSLVSMSDSSIVNGNGPFTGGGSVTFNVTANKDSAYLVLADNGCQLALNDTAWARIYPPIDTNLTFSDTVVCSGDSAEITINPTSAPFSYMLYKVGSPNTNLGTFNDQGGQITFDILPDVNDTSYYIVRISDLNCTALNTDTAVVIAKPLPDDNPVLSAVTICERDTAQIVLNNSFVSTVYTLRDDNDTLHLDINGVNGPLSFDVVPDTTTRYIVEAGLDQCFISLDTTVVTVNPAPIDTFTLTDLELCSNTSDTVFLSGSQSGVNYTLAAVNGNIAPQSLTGNGAALAFVINVDTASSTLQLTATDAFGCSSIIRDTANIRVFGPPSDNVQWSDDSICLGETARLFSTNTELGVTYFLQDASSVIIDSVPGSVGTVELNYTGTTNETFTVIAINDSAGCTTTLSDQPSVVVSPLPNTNLRVVGDSVCTGDSAYVEIDPTTTNVNYFIYNETTSALVGNPAGYPGNGALITMPFLPVVSDDYFIEAVNEFACVDTLVNRAHVHLKPLPNFTLELVPEAVCGSAQARVGVVNSEIGVNYQLENMLGLTQSTNLGLGFGDTLWMNVIDTLETRFRVYASLNNCGGFMLDTAVLIRDSLPLNNLTVSDPVVCAGISGNIEVNSSQSGVAYSLFDVSNDTLVAGPVPGNDTTIAFTITTVVPKQYYVVAQGANGCSVSLLDQANVDTTAGPDVTLTVLSPGDICAGDSALITVMGTEVGYDYLLVDVSTGDTVTDFRGDGSNRDFNVAPLLSTTYDIRVRIPGGVCGATLTNQAFVVVNPLPDVAISLSATPICENELAVVTGTGTSLSSQQYILFNPDNGAVIDTAFGNGSNLLFEFVADSTISLQMMATDIITSCVDTNVQVITQVVSPIPLDNIIAPEVNLCSGSTAEVTIENATIGMNYQLLRDGVPFGPVDVAGSPTLTFTASVDEAMTLHVEAIRPPANCALLMSDSIIITEVPAPLNTLRATADTICLGGVGTVTVENTNSIVNYSLVDLSTNSSVSTLPGNGGNLIFGNLSGYTSTTSFEVRALHTVSNCEVVLEDTPLLVVGLGIQNPGTAVVANPICSGEAAAITISNSETSVSYQLEDLSGIRLFGPVSGNGGDLTFNIPADSIFSTVSYQILGVGDVGGCSAYLSTNPTINVVTAPRADISVFDTTVCDGVRASVRLGSSELNVNYFAVGDFGSIPVSDRISGTGGELLIPINQIGNGDYLIMAELNGGSCVTELDQGATVFMDGGPIAEFSMNSSSVSVGGTIAFSNESSDATSLAWDFGQEGDDDTSTEENPEFTFDEAGNYDVQLAIVNENGCRDTIVKPVIVSNSWAIPSAFSPNGDGVNDFFWVIGGVIEYELHVFNKWGQELFSTTTQSVGWDGTFNGEEQQDGVYIYTFRGKDIDGRPIEVSGDVTLVR